MRTAETRRDPQTMATIATSPTRATGALRSGHTRGTQLAVRLILGATFLWCFQHALKYASLFMSITFAPYDDEGYVLVSVRTSCVR